MKTRRFKVRKFHQKETVDLYAKDYYIITDKLKWMKQKYHFSLRTNAQKVCDAMNDDYKL